MKNNILFLLGAGIFALFSCGTSNRASYTATDYQNGIYYTPDTRLVQAYDQSENELSDLQQKTNRAIHNRNRTGGYDAKSGIETIRVGDTNQVNIDYNPNITYSIVDDDESYEARLRKFDSPTYTVNIELGSNWDDPWYNPWWGPSYGWYRPYGITWGTGWYNPWWGTYYTWYGPGWGYPWWGNSWYDPWYGWNGWYDPFWGPSWGPGWHDHWWGPGPGHYRGRDVYYGKRTSNTGGPSYTTGNRPNNQGSTYRRNPNLNQVRGNNMHYGTSGGTSGSGTPAGGSIYRRGGNSGTYNGAVYNNAAANKGQAGVTARPNYGTSGNNSYNSQGSMYRRSATPVRNSSAATGTSNTYRNNTGRNNTYSTSPVRSNSGSTYNRSTYSPTRSSSYSTGSSATRSSGTSSGSSATRSSGSSYRR